jgi:hypothetical protein
MEQRMKTDKLEMLSLNQVAGRGPFGGRLISLAEACELADQVAFEADKARQEARERDAADWAWPDDAEAGDTSG